MILGFAVTPDVSKTANEVAQTVASQAALAAMTPEQIQAASAQAAQSAQASQAAQQAAMAIDRAAAEAKLRSTKIAIGIGVGALVVGGIGYQIYLRRKRGL